MTLPDHHDFPAQYEKVTQAIVNAAAGQDKFVHVCAGLGFWLLAAIVLRRPLHSPWPLLVIVVLEACNEYVDFLAQQSWVWHDTIADAIATWIWPCLIALAIAKVPALRRR